LQIITQDALTLATPSVRLHLEHATLLVFVNILVHFNVLYSIFNIIE